MSSLGVNPQKGKKQKSICKGQRQDTASNLIKLQLVQCSWSAVLQGVVVEPWREKDQTMKKLYILWTKESVNNVKQGWGKGHDYKFRNTAVGSVWRLKPRDLLGDLVVIRRARVLRLNQWQCNWKWALGAENCLGEVHCSRICLLISSKGQRKGRVKEKEQVFRGEMKRRIQMWPDWVKIPVGHPGVNIQETLCNIGLRLRVPSESLACFQRSLACKHSL